MQEAKLGSAIQETTGIPCQCNEYIGEVLRGVRMHFTRFIGDLKVGLALLFQRQMSHAAKGGQLCWQEAGGNFLWAMPWIIFAIVHGAC